MINKLLKNYPQLNVCADQISAAADELIRCFESGGKLMLCGNGGSSADCEHISGELMKGFLKKRPLSTQKRDQMKKNCADIEDAVLDGLQGALPAIPLPSFTALNSAFSNDADPALIYAQSVMALAKENDVLIAISTSGNSKNIVNAAKVARALGVKVIALSGGDGGQLRKISHICICVPENETYKVQELHLPVYHCLCAQIERHFFD